MANAVRAEMRTGRSCGGAFVAILMSGLSAASAQDAAQSPTILDDLEFKLEIGRHERLIRRRMAEGATLAPFRSDGCSGGLSTGWALVTEALPVIAQRHGDRPPWEHCCLVHDRAYHMAGPSDADAAASFDARRAADEALRQCVIGTAEDRLDALSVEYALSREEVSRIYRAIADVMHRAVRLGGVPCSGLSWRWGFGWPQCD
jgi:hypothetical protein